MPAFLADENIHPRLIGALRGAGFDVAGVRERGWFGAADEQVLEWAVREGRILLTADKDFGAILEAGALAGRGRVMLLRYRLLHWDAIARDLVEVMGQVTQEYESNPRLLVVVEEGQYRVRRYGGVGG